MERNTVAKGSELAMRLNECMRQLPPILASDDDSMVSLTSDGRLATRSVSPLKLVLQVSRGNYGSGGDSDSSEDFLNQVDENSAHGGHDHEDYEHSAHEANGRDGRDHHGSHEHDDRESHDHHGSREHDDHESHYHRGSHGHGDRGYDAHDYGSRGHGDRGYDDHGYGARDHDHDHRGSRGYDDHGYGARDHDHHRSRGHDHHRSRGHDDHRYGAREGGDPFIESLLAEIAKLKSINDEHETSMRELLETSTENLCQLRDQLDLTNTKIDTLERENAELKTTIDGFSISSTDECDGNRRFISSSSPSHRSRTSRPHDDGHN